MSDEERLRQYLRKVTGDLRKAHRRLRHLEEGAREPIAIVGMACRYPGGVQSPDTLWQLLAAGGDGISEFPTDRGLDLEQLYDPDPDRPGTVYTREGGFIEDATQFDARFFGIGPHEAMAMDPQQRVLLETVWEAIENAGLDPESLRGSDTAVFAGASTSGYQERVTGDLEAFRLTGTTQSVVSGRIAYTLGLEGAAVTVDTACSSSLVTLHLACQGLLREDCSLALAGGVSLMVSPYLYVDIARQRGLAPDGRCKAFSADANGTGFSEGVGMLVLERLSDAVARGHRVLAVVRGSAVNQDGASNGLTAPNGPSQERVIRQALANAGLSPGDVDAVEAHGTGTTLGDPIEAEALIATYGQDRSHGPLWLGSLKSNIGHTVAAAGVAGVIKMVLAMRHEQLPPTLHVHKPNPHVDWSTGDVQLLTEAQPWPVGERPRRAAVSSFGISGTNAHVIVEEAPPAGVQIEEEPPEDGDDKEDGLEVGARSASVVPFMVSGSGEAGLRGQAGRLRSYLDERPELLPLDVGWSLASCRAQLGDRAVVLAAGREELVAGLEALEAGVPAAGVVRGSMRPGKTVFVFPGQGTQWPGMALGLWERSGAFRELMEACEGALSGLVEWSLGAVLRGESGAPSLERVDVVQPALWAVMVSLAGLWRSFGVEPSVVVGHSQGEIAAATVAGGLSLEDGARVVALRSRAVRELLAGRGGMASVSVSEKEVEGWLARLGGGLSLAAVNGPASVVVSGEDAAIEELVAGCEAEGMWARRIPVDYPSHSPQVEALQERLLSDLAGLRPRSGEVPMLSTVTGELIDTAALDAGYWYRSLRHPIRFAEATQSLIDAGAGAFVEVSPHPGLTVALQDSVDHAPVAVFGTLRRDHGDPDELTRALAQAHAHGLPVDWQRYWADSGAQRVELPTYAFQRQRYWLDPPTNRGDPSAVGLTSIDHPFLAASTRLAVGDEWLFTGQLTAAHHPWLADHLIHDNVLFPGAAFLELALTVGHRLGCNLIEELVLEAPLILGGDPAVQLQVTVGAADDGGRREVAIYTCEDPDAEWIRHATSLVAPAAEGVEEAWRAETWPPPGAEPVDVTSLYDGMADLGFGYGPAFQGVVAAWRRGDQVFAEVTLDDENAAGAEDFGLHPALFDATLHGYYVLGAEGAETDGVPLPFSLTGVRVHRRGASVLRVCLTQTGVGGLRLTATDAAGVPVLSVDQLTFRSITVGRLQTAGVGASDDLYELDWVDVTLPDDARDIRVTRFDGDLAALAEAAPDAVVAEPVGAAQALELVQAWLAGDGLGDVLLAVVTRGAVAVDAVEAPDPAAAAVWGLVRSAQAEHPDRLLLVDTDGDGSDVAWARLMAIEESQLALRGSRAYVPRLRRASAPMRDAPLDGKGTVLITGGTGVVGGLVARRLAERHGARHLLLLSRRGGDAPGAHELCHDLEGLGCTVTFAACDAADREQLAAVIAGIPPEQPLSAVVHAAGALDDATIESLTTERLQRVMRPKVDAALLLHELTAEIDLSAFVLLSSAAGTIGSPGQGNYAAANAALDALAQLRHAAGLPAQSLAWGLWAVASGMTGHLDETDVARLTRMGTVPLPTERGLELLDAALGRDVSLLVPIGLDMTALRAQGRVGMLPAVLSGLVRLPGRRRRRGPGSLAQRLAAAPEAEWDTIVLEVVRAQVADMLGYESADDVDPDRAFKELGFDSLRALELRNRLAQVTGLRLPATLVFDHPTAATVAVLVRGRVEGIERSDPVGNRAPVRVDEPLVIVGMGCRYPGGVGSPEGLWGLVVSGVDAISGFPGDRGWDLERLYDPDPDRAGTVYAREGGFIEDVAGFDAGFFGIGSGEALAMDPQQRVLLEVAWEALEHAGIDPESLRGSDTGVFAGAGGSDYGAGAGAELEGLRLTGSLNSVVSGRLAYVFGLEGPAVTVDTACSSSLVALHWACQALRAGDCSMALAGGVTVMSSPFLHIEFSRQRGLAPDGRCKSFAASANGVGWSEGVGLLVVERLSDAVARGHRVLAVIRGSAVNQDGASNGLTAPNGPSQERVIRQALANAGLSPADVDCVEAHGTGTALGDPIEAQALIAAYGQDRTDGPLRIGSVKSNIGHTVAAAGVAGVIKMVEGLRHQVLPPTLHVDEPSPHVDWSAGDVQLLTEAQPWPNGERPRRAAVSSFGVSGTNAHVILEEAPPVEKPAAEEPRVEEPAVGVSELPVPWMLSAKSEAALREQAERLRIQVEQRPGLSGLDVGFELATARSHLEWRAATAGLEGLGSVVPTRVLGGRSAVMFSGQGAHRSGMGRGLYECFPAFRQALEQVCDPQWLFSPDTDLVRTENAQLGLFAFEVALFRLVESLGVRPDLLVGHSIGEITAAHIAGVLSLEDARTLVEARGRLMGELPAGGAMLAVEASEAEIVAEVADLDGRVAVAAVNAERAVVVSGDVEAIADLEARWALQRRTTRLRVSHAFHSPRMDPMLDAFGDVCQRLTFRPPHIPVVSNATGEIAGDELIDPGYWVRHVRHTVRFADGITALADAGVTRFMELGPDAVLAGLATETLDGQNDEAVVLAAQRAARDETETFVRFLADAHCAGVPVDWDTFYAGRGAQRVDLPTYPFQHQHYWLTPQPASDPAAAGQDAADHPFLAAAVPLAGGDDWLFTGRLSLAAHPWLADHTVLDTVLLPGTGFVELALAAGHRVGCDTIEELTLEAPLVLDRSDAVQLQVTVGQADGTGERPVAIYSRRERDGDEVVSEWTRHAAGTLAPTADTVDDGAEQLAAEAWPPEGAEPVDIHLLYDKLAEHGLDYGPAFQGLTAAWRRGDEVLAEVDLDSEEAAEAGRFGIHPALFDAGFHAGFGEATDRGVWLPFSWTGVRLHGTTGASSLRIRLSGAGTDALTVAAVDGRGDPVLSVRAVAGRPVEAGQLAQLVPVQQDSLFRIDWVPNEAAPSSPVQRLAILGEFAAPGVDAERYADLTTLAASDEPPDAVLTQVRAENPAAAVRQALDLLQAWLAHEQLAHARLVLVTTGDATSAAVAGLVRSAHSEHPGRFLAVEVDGQDASWQALSPFLEVDEPHISVREGRAHVPRLTPVSAPTPSPSGPRFDADGTVLITGGTSGLGAIVARHLVSRHGVRHLMLASRHGPQAAGIDELVADLAALGCEATVVACDVADRESCAALLTSVPVEHPLEAVVHAAGVLDDGAIESLSAEQVERVMAPKVAGVVHLHELTKDRELSAFVLFSSAAATIGSPGQGNYTAANAFLDEFARFRHAQGLPATSLAWGLWDQSGGGMASELGAAGLARLARLGMTPLAPDRGLALLDAALRVDEPALVAAGLDTAALRAQARVGMLPPVLRSLVRMPAPRQREGGGSLARRLADVPEEQWDAVVLDLVRTHVATVLGGVTADAVPHDRAFKDLGFDSLSALELRNRLTQATGVRLPATLVFDYPNPSAVVRLLLSQLDGMERAGAVNRHAVDRSEDPIAIVGVSCRYPGGVRSPQDLWELVASGTDAITEFPDDRGWDVQRLYDPDPAHPGTSYVREGGFLEDAGGFDAGFFGIGPREALAMDPQQRLLLEATWEAFEDAGIAPGSVRGSDTGVFTGIMYQDYGHAAAASARRDEVEGYLTVGSAGSVASGRVAYVFGLEGPAVTVDTACSSSLVTLHLACQALRGGECSMTLAGGATVLSFPSVFVDFSRQRGLAADGRCKSFAASADGVGWSEGVGLLVLERLSDAVRRGHRVLAVVRGSAVNQDGASNGLTAPNGPSQERVIRQALANAGLSPADVDCVEAHGTGTTLGDPIEAQALIATYGQDRTDGPLRIGSIKSNIGHTQAAAGVAGVIKIVEGLRHQVLPPTLHVDEPSPHVDWSAGEVELLTKAQPWPRRVGGRLRRAGVSSFGVSGTNAHVIVEEAPPVEAPPVEAGLPSLPVVPWVLSAPAETAVVEQAARLRAHLGQHPELSPLDVGFELATTRSHLGWRAGVVAAEGLDSVVPVAVREGKTAVMFSGQGAQHTGMGQGLYEVFPVFREALEEICDPHWLFSPDTDLDRTDNTQLALFAFEVALYRLVESLGVKPDLLIGHSVGEITAAHVAGTLSLEDGRRLVEARGRLMGELPAGGAMLAVEAREDEIVPELDGRVAVAAVNGERAVVVSGDLQAIEDLEARLGERRTRRLRVSHAFHSPRMEPMLDAFRHVCEGLSLQAPRVPVVSNLTGQIVGDELADPDYWVRHVRDCVRFADGIAALASAGVKRFLELGPDAVLATMAHQSIDGDDGVILAAQRAQRDETETFMRFLADAHCAGVPLDWQAFYAGRGARRVDVPTYAFRHQHYWLTPQPTSDPAAAGLDAAEHPFLAAAVPLAGCDEWVFTGRFSLATHPWLADHAVFESGLLPGTGFVEMALAAGQRIGYETVEELTLEAPLVLNGSDAVQVQVTVGEAADDGGRPVAIYSRSERSNEVEDPEWARHAAGTLVRAAATVDQAAEQLAVAAWPPEGAEPVDIDLLYDRFAEHGVDYGPAFQAVTAVWRNGQEIFAEVRLDDAQASTAARFGIHPALFDAAFHAGFLDEVDGPEPGRPALPFSWDGVSLGRNGASSLCVRLAPAGEGALSLAAVDDDGAPVLAVKRLVVRAVDAAQLDAVRRAGARDPLFALEWVEVAMPASNGLAHTLAVLGDLAVEGVERRHADLAALGGAIDAGEAVPDVVFAAPALPADDLAAEPTHAAVQATLDLVQSWLGDERFAESRLVFATRGAVAVRAGEVPDPVAAALWGLLRSAQSEHPGRFVAVDLDRDAQPPWERLLGVDEPQLAARGATAYALRLRRATVPSDASITNAPVSFDGESTVLVTGGTGGLGVLVARHLADTHGVRQMVLASRRGVDAPDADELVDELAELGCSATVVTCDVADREQLASLITEHQPTAVIHTAGVLDDATIESLTAEQLDRVMRPKVDAALHLHELTKGRELSAFVLFSSAAATIGTPGQGNYAAANAFLDALAQRRRADGLPAMSLAWGLWDQSAGGMANGLAAAGLARLARLGMTPLAPDRGLALFDAALGVDEPALVAAGLDTAVLREHVRTGMLPAVLRGLVRTPVRRQREGGGSLARRLAGVPEEEWDRIVLELVLGDVAAVLGHATADVVDAESTFKDLGFDSLSAVELRNSLTQATGVRLPATLVFDYPKPAAVAGHLLEKVSQKPGRASDSTVTDEEARRTLASIPIARLREAGLLDALVRLGSGNGGDGASELDREDPSAAIDEMDVEDLVRMTFEESS
jgi:acyl transferase domain-containing protein/acyl carrier protein